MLSKQYRMRAGLDFERVRIKGGRIRGIYVNANYMKKRSGGLHIAVVAPMRLDKRATARNRIRRRIFEAIRRNLHLYLKENCDILVLARTASREAPFEALKQDLSNLFKKIFS